jgi:hypothetical protein
MQPKLIEAERMSETNSKASQRRRYHAPQLTEYGDVHRLTQTQSNSKNKNDSAQGQDNLKT